MASSKRSRRPRSEHSGRTQGDLTTDPETSERLSRIRQKGTKPELEVRGIIHALGHRYRVINRDLPGSPDIANRSRKGAIFVHGCFWHHHAGCPKATVPKRNKRFWEAKFEANQKRDRRVAAELRRHGFKTITVWECETKRPAKLMRRLDRALGSAS